MLYTSIITSKLFLTLAWRNIWRNKKRSLILMSSVVLAVFVAVLFTSMQNGQGEYLVNLTVSMYTGHLQVHKKGYWEDRTLEYSMISMKSMESVFEQNKDVKAIAPRLETFALLANLHTTKYASLIGIDPQKEYSFTQLQNRLVRGRYLSDTSTGLMLAEGLAKNLGVDVGDSIVVYSQGWQGVTVAALVPVEGIIQYPIPEPNNTMAYLALSYAQDLFNCNGRLTSIAVLLNGREDRLPKFATRIQNHYGEEYEVMTWYEMMPELVQAIQSNDAGTVMLLFILYLVIGFGIFGTVMMMTLERIHEFGVLLSLGFERWRMMIVCFLEAVMLSFTACAVGIILSVPVVFYLTAHPIQFTGDYAQAMLAYGYEPILPMSNGADVFWIQALVVIGLALVSSFYPAIVIRSLNPSVAIRSK